MSTPLNINSQAYIPKNKGQKKEAEKLNINAKEFMPKNSVKIGATYNYIDINSDYSLPNKSNIKKIVVTAFDKNDNAICHLISSQKNEKYENDYVEVELGEKYKKTYYVSTNNCIVVNKEQLRNNKDITLQYDVISKEKINEINNKSKNTHNFYALPENYGQQFTNYTIANNIDYNINNDYSNMFYGYYK